MPHCRLKKCTNLDCHGSKDDEIAKVESKRSDKKSQLVLMGGGSSLPRMQVPEHRHAESQADSHQREVRREHLRLQIPKLMPRQIPKHTHTHTQTDALAALFPHMVLSFC